ncbi:hypothetical protein SO802_023601 [Lithocarpus litseifolius]|uniref:Uncharacterized protein n=1 Tax=Lithocarpus litseifolius TaxID=425828 RepID=A0AAW2C859_9ROSI
MICACFYLVNVSLQEIHCQEISQASNEEHYFKNKDAFEAFMDFYREAVIIVEREVDFGSLANTFIPDVFRDRTWAPLLTGIVEVHDILVREFFLNAFKEGDHLNYWVKGNEFSISAVLIQNLLQIRPVIPKSSLPYDKRITLVLEAALNLGGARKRQSLHTISFSSAMTTLVYIMLYNPYPVRNLTILSQPRPLFLHDLYMIILTFVLISTISLQNGSIRRRPE